MKERKSRRRKKAVYGTIFAIIMLSIALIYASQYSTPLQTRNQATDLYLEFRVAIVDQLGLKAPNQDFIETATNILETGGYTVDYYESENVTVELFRRLPAYGYSLIILRVHSALLLAEKPPVAFFTSEPYSSSKYLHEQITDQLACISIQLNDPTYFGIRPEFVRSSMGEQFPNSLVIMMGCNGLTYTEMAKALTEKGVKAYISWDEAVLASHTDKATTQLLRFLITEKQTIEQAVTKTMMKVGPDPAYKSELAYYPFEAGKLTIKS